MLASLFPAVTEGHEVAGQDHDHDQHHAVTPYLPLCSAAITHFDFACRTSEQPVADTQQAEPAHELATVVWEDCACHGQEQEQSRPPLRAAHGEDDDARCSQRQTADLPDV